jgi:predicted dehydrogenase
VRVVAIWNRSRGRAEALASRLEHEPRLYDRWQDMISDDQIAGFLVEGARTFHLAELSDDLIGQFSLTVGPGQDRWNMILIGDEGSLAIPDAGTSLVRQRADDDEPVELPISADDRAPAGVDLLQHTWNRLIAAFVRAVRDGDIGHENVPHLATLVDGLRTEEIIAAARQSNDARRWVTVRSG